MLTRAVDTYQDAEIDTQPRGIRGTTVTTLVVAGETTYPGYYTLEGEEEPCGDQDDH